VTVATRATPRPRARLGWMTLGAAALLLLPHFVYPVLALDILAWGLFAVAFDLLFGYSGLLSFGHAAFWGVSAYVTAYALGHGWNVPLALLAGAASALLVAVPIGFLSVRSYGIYFSMITLAFAQMISFLALQLTDFTGGENGLQGLARPSLLGLNFDSNLVRYYFALVVFAVGMAVAYRLVHSPFGRVTQAVRDNEVRAQSVGYAPFRFKFTGLAGGLSVFGHGVVSLDVTNWRTSGEVVIMTLLGGTATAFGPVVGAGIVLVLRDILSSSNVPVGIVTGLVFVAVVLFFRAGVVGTVQKLLRRR
jgi:branched-chain amino acid transport system permease protein